MRLVGLKDGRSAVAILRQGLTLEQFLDLPEHKPALEFADGMVTQKVAPKGRHSLLQARLTEWFNGWAGPRRLALALPELRTTFAEKSYVPDVAVYRWERVPRTAAGRIADDFLEPPDVAVEIVSPRQSVDLLVQRCRWYVSHGVRMALLVDPQQEIIMEFRPHLAAQELRADEQLDFGEILPGLRCTVADVFGLLMLE
jgi:Uma2 family endonuclease